MRSLLRPLGTLLWLGIGGLLLLLALHRVDLQRVGTVLGRLQVWPLALALGLDVLAILAKSGKWQMLLGPTARVSLLRLQGAIYAGGAAAVVLPLRLDEAVRAAVAARLCGLPPLSVLGSMALERLVDLALLLFVMLALVWLLPLPPWILRGVGVVSLVAAAVALFLFAARRLALSPRPAGPLGRLLGRLASGSRALARPGLLALAALLGASEWVLTGGMAFLVVQAGGLHLPLVGLLLVTMLVFASFALPLSPAGIGVLEVACRLTLPRLYGLTEQQAVALALVLHALLLVPMTMVGATVLMVTGVRLSEARRWREILKD